MSNAREIKILEHLQGQNEALIALIQNITDLHFRLVKAEKRIRKLENQPPKP